MAQELAQDVCAMDEEDCPALRWFWPRICWVRGWTTQEQTSKPARQAYLKTITTERVLQVKGEKASQSKWMSSVKAFKVLKPVWRTKGYGVTKLCILKEWSHSFEDIPGSLKGTPFAGIKLHKDTGSAVFSVQQALPQT